MSELHSISVIVNGQHYERQAEPRLLLSDFLRHELGLTGTHVGCEHGVCGACTILFDGQPARSCLMLAVQAAGHELMTVEGLAPGPQGETGAHGGAPDAQREVGAHGGAPLLHPLQQAFWEAHGLQCGFCTPGILMTLLPFLQENPQPTETEIREAISGNLCRCTGYQNIVNAARLAAEKLRA